MPAAVRTQGSSAAARTSANALAMITATITTVTSPTRSARSRFWMEANSAPPTPLDCVTAARAHGVGPLRLLHRHIVPNAVRTLIVFAST